MENTFSHEEIQKQVQQIMEHFDFEKVHAHMVEKNHKWLDEIPTIEEL